jgi:hypothetical protein
MLKVKWHGDTTPTCEKLATIKKYDPLMIAAYIYININFRKKFGN